MKSHSIATCLPHRRDEKNILLQGAIASRRLPSGLGDQIEQDMADALAADILAHKLTTDDRFARNYRPSGDVRAAG